MKEIKPSDYKINPVDDTQIADDDPILLLLVESMMEMILEPNANNSDCEIYSTFPIAKQKTNGKRKPH